MFWLINVCVGHLTCFLAPVCPDESLLISAAVGASVPNRHLLIHTTFCPRAQRLFKKIYRYIWHQLSWFYTKCNAGDTFLQLWRAVTTAAEVLSWRGRATTAHAQYHTGDGWQTSGLAKGLRPPFYRSVLMNHACLRVKISLICLFTYSCISLF